MHSHFSSSLSLFQFFNFCLFLLSPYHAPHPPHSVKLSPYTVPSFIILLLLFHISSCSCITPSQRHSLLSSTASSFIIPLVIISFISLSSCSYILLSSSFSSFFYVFFSSPYSPPLSPLLLLLFIFIHPVYFPFFAYSFTSSLSAFISSS